MLVSRKVGLSARAIVIASLCVPPVIGFSHSFSPPANQVHAGAALEASRATLCPFEETAGRQLVAPLAVCTLLRPQQRYLI
jgi:hypothetical protein